MVHVGHLHLFLCQCAKVELAFYSPEDCYCYYYNIVYLAVLKYPIAIKVHL